MRLISRQVDAVLQKSVPVNFGLYFNKFLEYHQDFNYVVQKGKNKWDKPSFKPLCGESSGKPSKNSPLLQFNNLYCQSQKQVNHGLRDRHLRQSNFCQAAKTDGYSVFIFHVRLQSPYISGLGMSHPTETGMIFDHTLGVPYIPAAGQKGLLRLVYMINDLKDDNDNWLPLDQLEQDEKGEPCWHEDDLSRTLFGFSDKQDALAGRLVILDAYPLSQPELAEDILNPHYGDYYSSQGEKCGPTEDQNPVPVKFLVLKKGQEFVFRFLLHYGFQKAPSSDIEGLSARIKAAMKIALTEEGFGAKTALGYGRFEILGEGEEPEKVQQWFRDVEEAQQEKERKRLIRIEEIKYPWRSLLRKIEILGNWGDFKVQVLENDGATDYREKKEFAEGVKATALRVVRRNPKKWTEERDKQVADWFAASPVAWEPCLSKTQPKTIPVEPVASDLLQSIAVLSDWSTYQQTGLKISSLDRPCAEALKKKFSEWGCKKSKNKNKKKAFKQLVDRIEKLSRK